MVFRIPYFLRICFLYSVALRATSPRAQSRRLRKLIPIPSHTGNQTAAHHHSTAHTGATGPSATLAAASTLSFASPA